MLAITTKVHDDLWSAYQARKFNIFVLEGGSRSSKTFSIIQFWIKWAYLRKNKPSSRVAICRLKGTWISATVLKDFVDVLKAYGLYSEKNHNKTQKIITLYNTEFWFMGLDDPQKVHGFKSNAFWINEAVEAGYDDYAQLMQRCTGFALLDYNPSEEEHWIYDRILKRPQTYYSHSTMLHNPLIAPTARKQILSYEPTEANYAAGTADERKWKIYGLGQRASIEGLIWENFTTVKDIPAWAKRKHVYGLDFGYTNHPTAILDSYWTGIDNTLWLDEVCYSTGMLNNKVGEKIIESGLKTTKGWADSAEPKSVDEIYYMGINVHKVPKPPGSIITGIDIVKRLKLNVTERSLNFLKEIRNYTYKQDKNGKWFNEPAEGQDDHLMDCLRYICFMEHSQKVSSDVTASTKAAMMAAKASGGRLRRGRR